MDVRTINKIQVSVTGEISDQELTVYLTRQQAKSTHKIIKAAVTVDGDYINIDCTFEVVPFERIRRITGYLVGTTEKWNDAKRAELKDRVTHGQREILQQ